MKLLDALYNNEINYFVAHPQGEYEEKDNRRLIFSGSFNPLHEGHINIANYVLDEGNLYFEISIMNCDKGYVGQACIEQRINKFLNLGLDVLISNASTFARKASLFEESTFIVGVDTIKRINDIKYYNNSELVRNFTIRQISNNDCGFWVFERNNLHLDDLELCDELKSICYPAVEFNSINISSTEIRKEKQY